MAAFFPGYASPPMVPVERKVFHVKKHTGLNGRIPENAAMNDHVANAPCFPETCPEGFRLLSDQSMTAHCYKYHEAAPYQRWEDALAFCTGTPGGYLWIPNTVQEADAVKNEFNLLSGDVIWTGANDIDKDGIFTFAIENSPFSFNDLPFGWETVSVERMFAIAVIVEIKLIKTYFLFFEKQKKGYINVAQTRLKALKEDAQQIRSNVHLAIQDIQNVIEKQKEIKVTQIDDFEKFEKKELETTLATKERILQTSFGKILDFLKSYKTMKSDFAEVDDELQEIHNYEILLVSTRSVRNDVKKAVIQH
ncbi:Hypothetical predicted protein [Mytilus galloprovincialis]|uniref:Uncharacterized protein n=1 Tax=Mytilus galloprovincialis TaxID=29158 RepID=A0A8B6CBU9_MYTGA|nr:Hypothetical predicted protein [Mytilus galloprovincialis]